MMAEVEEAGDNTKAWLSGRKTSSLVCWCVPKVCCLLPGSQENLRSPGLSTYDSEGRSHRPLGQHLPRQPEVLLPTHRCIYSQLTSVHQRDKREHTVLSSPDAPFFPLFAKSRSLPPDYLAAQKVADFPTAPRVVTARFVDSAQVKEFATRTPRGTQTCRK